MKRFAVTLNLAGKQPELSISEDVFTSAKNKFAVLSNLLLMEERFDSLAANFLELEESLVSRLLRFSRIGFVDGNHQMYVRRDVNRLLMNVLSSARGYIDQLPQVTGRIFGKQDSRALHCSGLLRSAYDERPGYRIFEALRNHTQHSGFPVHSISYGAHMIGEYPKLIATKNFQVRAHPKVLAEDEKLKPAIRDELLAMGESVDLQPLLRQYVAGIASAHEFFRSETLDVGQAAQAHLEQLKGAYLQLNPEAEDCPAMYAACIDEKFWLERVFLTSGNHEYLQYLRSINVHLQDVDKMFLIGSVTKDA